MLALHPYAFVTVTVYVLDVVTPMLEVVAPVLHRYPTAPAPCRVVVAPVQADTVPDGVMGAVGIVLMTTYVGADVAVHPEPLVTITV